jgi:GntR family transcriptional regulator
VIRFRVDARSAVPPYQQIVQQVRQALRMGVLDVGDQLPSVREVVTATAINPNTVLKAYRDLEREGLVTAEAGRGTFVTKRPDGPLVRLNGPVADPEWEAADVSLEDLVLAYMGADAAPQSAELTAVGGKR